MISDRQYFLEPSWEHNPKGPDGQGWNRLAIIALEPSPRCSMRPRSRQAALDTLRGMARFGVITAYDECTGQGRCATCPVACRDKLAWPDSAKIRDKGDHVEVESAGQRTSFDSWKILLASYDLPMLQRYHEDGGAFWMTA